MTTVVNVRIESCDVFIGRPSLFGNPFRIGIDGSRGEVIDQYRQWFDDKIRNDPAFLAAVLKLRGKKLGCYCKPLACHGDVIADFLNNSKEEQE